MDMLNTLGTVSGGATHKCTAIWPKPLLYTYYSSMMKTFYKSLDMKTLDLKTHLCRSLWQACSDPQTRVMSKERLIIELRAGGIESSRIDEVKKTLAANGKDLDFLDFLTYIPLFLAIHNAVITNPFRSSVDWDDICSCLMVTCFF